MKVKLINNKVRIEFEKGFIDSESVEALLLYSILQKLEELKAQEIDIENVLIEMKNGIEL